MTGVDVTSVSGNGATAQVTLSGRGFIEGDGEYRYGSTVVLDGNLTAGPDVTGFQFENERSQMTAPLDAGSSGAIVVKTAGGTSAPFSVTLAAIDSVALSGTPANAGQASANPGQAITLVGSGLSLQSDLLVRYVDSAGNGRMFLLNPTAAAADGSSAEIVLRNEMNGAFDVMLLGASGHPLLQIVPVVTSFDENGRIQLFGKGFVEGASTYQFAGGAVVDSQLTDSDANVLGNAVDNDRADVDNPAHGFGPVTVTTAGARGCAGAECARYRVQPAERYRLRYSHRAALGRRQQQSDPDHRIDRQPASRCRASR